MEKKILFLDDNKNRHNKIAPHLGNYDAAYTADEAIRFLIRNTYDLIFLDHDLGGKEFVDSFCEETTGYTVAKWMVENEYKTDALVIIHSLNDGGAANMMSIMKNKYYLSRIPFTGLEEEVIGRIMEWVPNEVS